MKKILFGIALPIILVVFLGAPYYFGIKAQESLTTQYQILKDTFFFDVVSHQYDRGWFSATETTVIRFHPTALSNLTKQLPSNLKTVLGKEITIINHVKHGLFADGFTPVRASISTEFKYDPEVQKILARFFNEKTPIALHNIIYLTGNGKLNVQVAPFDYEELSGIKLNWKGLNSQIDYASNFNQYNTLFTIPGLKATLADKGGINIENIAIHTETHNGDTGVSLGSSDMKMKLFDVAWKENIDYNIHLNELVNAVTDLQIGAFINPTGSIAPSNITVHNLAYTSNTDEKSGFINTQGHFTFEKLNYGQDQYGPLDIDIAAEHLDGKSLTALKKSWQKISTENLTGEQIQEKMLATVRNEGAGLFTQNPIFKINKFDLTMPSGYVKANGTAQFNGLQATDLSNAPNLIQKLKANLKLDISNKVLESFAINQARSLFATDSPNDAQAQKDVDETIRLMVVGTLNNFAHDGYITQANDAFKTEINIENNKIALNGKPFTIQSDEEMLKDIEADPNAPPPPENDDKSN